MTSPHGTVLTRLIRGTRWSWLDHRHVDALPSDLDSKVMTLESVDRHHAKQGRSTARVRFADGPSTISVYLKRHYQLPWPSRLAALVNPSGRHSPAAAEWAHLERARSLGISVPEVVAVGERVGPWGGLQSYLMVAELVGFRPRSTKPRRSWSRRSNPLAFASAQAFQVVVEMAEIDREAPLGRTPSIKTCISATSSSIAGPRAHPTGSSTLPDRPPSIGRPSM